jgi:polysaccharide biosynthesis/export protein
LRRVRNTKEAGVVGGTRLALVVSLAAMLLTGCSQITSLVTQVGEVNSWVDPTEPNIRPLGSPPLVKPILDTLDPKIEEPNDEFANATDIEPEDLQPGEGDYRIGRNDLLSISIYDLLGEGTGETVKTVRVSETGSVALDFIKPVHAEGLTEQELQDSIRQAYADAGQIRNARVTVEVAEERARTFSVWGNVNTVGQYQILQNDFRLLDALILAKGIQQSQGVDYCYVARRPIAQETPSTAPSETTPAPAPEEQNVPAPTPTTQLLQPPQSRAKWSSEPPLLSDAGSASQPAASGMLAPDATTAPSGVVEGQAVPATAPADASAAPTTEPAVTSAAPTSEPAVAATAPASQPEETSTVVTTQTTTQESGGATTQTVGTGPGGLSGFKFNAPSAFDRRVIRVPLRELLAGNLSYNVVIRPGDLIFVPDAVTGEFYMGGHVARAGPYSLTARKISLKQALVSAGGFDQVAIPGRAEIIRRIGQNKEVYVRVDLDKIFAGEQPDLYLKPNDIVYVGTNVIAPFLSAFRNAYRISYGFGFTYDQNFAPQTTTP